MLLFNNLYVIFKPVSYFTQRLLRYEYEITNAQKHSNKKYIIVLNNKVNKSVIKLYGVYLLVLVTVVDIKTLRFMRIIIAEL